MRLLISDANILIDFEDGALIRKLFELEETLAVPDTLFADELEERHGHLVDLGLVTLELREEAVLRVISLGKTYRKPSRLDLAALALADQEGCPLLTGDGDLRAAARAENVEVHGTLWLGEKLVLDELISVNELAFAYDRMRASGRRLPWGEARRRLELLRRAGR